MADQNLYCICHSRDDGRFMLACDSCENWFHGDCVNISRHRGKHLTTWYCASCVALHGMPPKMAEELAAEISSSTEDESSHSSADDSNDSESIRSNDDAQAAAKQKKRKAPSSSIRRSNSARVKRVAPALDAEAVQRRDEMRARTRDRLTDVLLPAVSEAVVAAMNATLAGASVGGAVSDSDVRNVATAVEACLFEQCGGVADNQYVGKARSLLFNLKTIDNAPLRVSLVRGQITPLQLCNMSGKDMAPARLAETIKRFEQQSMSQHVITAEVAAEKFKKTDVHANQSLSDKGAQRFSSAVAAEHNGDAINDHTGSLHASVEVRNDGGGVAAGAGAADASGADEVVERAPAVSMGRIQSFEDFDDGSLDGGAAANLDDIDEGDDAAALLEPESDQAHFGRRSSGGIERRASNSVDVEPYTPPGTPPPLTPSDDEFNGGAAARPSVNAQTALFGVNLDMDNLRADGTLNCRGKLPLAVVRALTPKMSVVGRMEMDKCDAYLEALATSSSRDRALCFVSASGGADGREKLARIAQTLRERSRVGVVKLAKSNPNLRECFLIPWNGIDPLPPFLTPFPTLVPQPNDDAPLLLVLVLSKQAGASGVASGLLTSDGSVPAPVVRAAARPQQQQPAFAAPPTTVPTSAPLSVGGGGGGGGGTSLSSALSSLAASLASGGGASLLAAMRASQPQPQHHQQQQAPPPPQLQPQPQQPQQQQMLPHQLHQQHLQMQQQMRQQRIMQMHQPHQQQAPPPHQHFVPQHQQQQQQHQQSMPPLLPRPPPLLPRPSAPPLLPLPIDPHTGLPMARNVTQSHQGW